MKDRSRPPERSSGRSIEEDPSVSIGLMSSDELRHSLQGRPIGRLLGVFAGEGRVALYRPTGAIYGDAMHKAVF